VQRGTACRVSPGVADPATDVRDLDGRFLRLCISALAGIVGSFAVTLVLPTRDHFPDPIGGCGFGHPDQGWLVEGGDPVLMLAGAIGIALGVYAMWSQRVRAKPRSTSLPRAAMLRSRGRVGVR
jgi:hypothetical protein